MNAVVHSEYGGPEVLRVANVEAPVPGPQELLVKVHAAALNPVDWHFVRGKPFPLRMLAGGIRMPRPNRRIGCDYAGTITAVGTAVREFTVGEPVLGMGDGTVAEYVAAPAARAVRMPQRLTFEQAAAIPLAGLTALQMLRDAAGVRAGHRVLIVGAAGGVGTFAVQLARSFGAEVTGVQSTSAVDLVRSLGANRLVDYTRQDFTEGAL